VTLFFIFDQIHQVKKGALLFLLLIIFSRLPASGQNTARFDDIKAGMKDPRLEQEAIEVANAKAIGYHWHETYTKAVIVSPDWEPAFDRNGALNGRTIHVELYAKMDNGKCGIIDFRFKQKLLTEGPKDVFSDLLVYDSNRDEYYVDCDLN
jgi:hypothetical protein